MKMLRTALAVLAAASLCACAALGAAGTIADTISAIATVAGRPANAQIEQTATTSTVGDHVVLRGTQGLIVAHNAYQTAAAAATLYVQSGRATPAQLARIRTLNDRALFLLDTGGTGLSLAQRAAEVLNIVAELDVFSGRRR